MKPNVHNCERSKTLVAIMRLTPIALIVATLVPAVGCTSRKQYAINEEILINERRMLEDEIYRVQFELRDALEENERLRAKLDKEDDARPRDARRLNSTTPQRADAQRDVDDERFFPGGDALRTGDRSSNEIETLPDFVPIPNSRADAALRKSTLAQANYVDVAPPKITNAVEQADYESKESDENATYEEEYGKYEDAPEDDGDDWTPIS